MAAPATSTAGRSAVRRGGRGRRRVFSPLRRRGLGPAVGADRGDVVPDGWERATAASVPAAASHQDPSDIRATRRTSARGPDFPRACGHAMPCPAPLRALLLASCPRAPPWRPNFTDTGVSGCGRHATTRKLGSPVRRRPQLQRNGVDQRPADPDFAEEGVCRTVPRVLPPRSRSRAAMVPLQGTGQLPGNPLKPEAGP